MSNKIANRDQNSIEMMNPSHADVIDWSQNCFPIGVAIPGDESAPWLRLDHEDLLILARLLNHPSMVKRPDGYGQAPAPSSASESLSALGKWAEGAAKWLKARNH